MIERQAATRQENTVDRIILCACRVTAKRIDEIAIGVGKIKTPPTLDHIPEYLTLLVNAEIPQPLVEEGISGVLCKFPTDPGEH